MMSALNFISEDIAASVFIGVAMAIIIALSITTARSER
jgi:hypothetical protein